MCCMALMRQIMNFRLNWNYGMNGIIVHTGIIGIRNPIRYFNLNLIIYSIPLFSFNLNLDFEKQIGNIFTFPPHLDTNR